MFHNFAHIELIQIFFSTQSNRRISTSLFHNTTNIYLIFYNTCNITRRTIKLYFFLYSDFLICSFQIIFFTSERITSDSYVWLHVRKTTFRLSVNFLFNSARALWNKRVNIRCAIERALLVDHMFCRCFFSNVERFMLANIGAAAEHNMSVHKHRQLEVKCTRRCNHESVKCVYLFALE